MHAHLPSFGAKRFPALFRESVDSLQVSLGYRCNQSCHHCHVAAGPHRTEAMSPTVIADVIRFLWTRRVRQLDLTGGAPELHPGFRSLVSRVRSFGVQVIDRCNLTVLEEPGQQDLAEFLAAHQVHIIASLPCYLEDTVDRQRGAGAYQKSIRALHRLNAVGYGQPGRGLTLDLAYNPPGAALPPAQQELELAYKTELWARHSITFDRLLALTNMPIARFDNALRVSGHLRSYLALLQSSHRPENLGHVMCRRTLNVDWRGNAYDCDFNQVLGLPLQIDGRSCSYLGELLATNFANAPIQVAGHCYGCTAGQGSSCTGALLASAPSSVPARVPPNEATELRTVPHAKRVPIEELR